MEIEEKERYFANHIGNTIIYEPITGNINTYKTGTIEGIFGLIWVKDENGNIEDGVLESAYLLLTPLGQITDEDAIEVAQMDRSLKAPVNLPGVGREREIAYGRNNVYLVIDRRCVADYLRSKGYALPWMHYSIPQLIEEGVLRLKEK